ncbi:MAG: anaerobic glycerol-3-phosphate dehydrogenase subunit C [Phycisphaerae bacterium]|nr:anaerobic glycerol-3-phosphate dehydrogenase subunit C [Phycisphaerae bacterium]
MNRDADSVARDLAGLVTCPVKADPLTRALYSTDASIYQIRPACVVFPKSTEDVVACVRYAREIRTPIVGRGGGSGLAGETLTTGIVLDFTRYLDRVIETDLDANWVRCQPGVILARLNAALAKVGRLFGPDPSSGNRAAIGGVIGNNATGAHSIKYGYTDVYVEALTVVLDDGEVVELSPTRPEAGATSRAGRLAWEIKQLIDESQPLIDRHMPPVKRNRSGYALNKVVADGQVHLGRLIAGSEGTLGLVVEAKVRVVPVPKARGLLQLNFADLEAMARAVPVILTCGPATIESMDGKLLELARQSYPRYRDVLPGGVAASLVIEHDGDDLDEVREKIERTRRAVDSATSGKEVLDPSDQRLIWAARKAAVPLLFRQPGPRQPVPFIEDAAVPPDRLAEYLGGLDEVFRRHEADVAVYGHAGDGEFHIRPYLDLHEAADVAKMRDIAEETFELAWSLGGTISGEHGEGLVRAEFIRRQYGPLYDVMRQVKRRFDPEGILNPGKIINDEPGVMTRNLRFDHRRSPGRMARTELIWRDGELLDEIERCNGNGECRNLDAGGTMCPIFRATRDEVASPRAHANMLRHWITGQLDEEILYSDEFKAAVATCVNCKTCHQACPSAVNIPKLMLEARAQIAARRGLTLTERLLAHSEASSKLGSLTAPLANLSMGMGWFRAVFQRVTGIDRRRPMPRFAWGSFVRRARRLAREFRVGGPPAGRVAVFLDLYANYHDHELARATIAVLRHNGVEVVVPDQVGCQMPAMCYGDLATARRGLRYNVERLAEAVRDGCTIVSGEPTATLTLREEVFDLIDSDEARLVAEHTEDVCGYLWRMHQGGRLRTDFRPMPMTLGYHMPCHLGALRIGRPGVELLRLIPELKVEVIEAGCCGLAGTYGFQQKGFETSMAAGARLAEALRAERIDAGATECATCKMQMELGGGKPTWHPLVLLARSHGLLGDS